MARQSDYYTAPEITRDLRHASAQSDIYSLGCIIHDMIGMEDRIPCGEIRESGEFGAILLGCTHKDPKKRFRSAKAVLDSLLSVDASSYPAPSEKSIDIVATLDGEEFPSEEAWEAIAHFLEYEANAAERRSICMKIDRDLIKALCAEAPFQANRVAISFASWVMRSSFNFEYCDPLANRLEAFFEGTDFEAKVECLIAMLEMGTSHNRWYVERKFVGLCGSDMDANLAKRMAVQFRIREDSICDWVKHLERSINFDRESFHPSLIKALSEICT